ncbi:HNH endonuclease [Variovorax boronicumulans]|uniref:HNH endonuclease n=1 Tax=Variovorax boronicumulans TaxID=436515 RepID=UPI002786DFB1|nr:HNH endonuclease signature motif containing protein [Variovorax boronicumulans]MDQ0040833.1 5-methylcytosine-specific restriction protein A [Variovorax boronicumulans]
MTLATLKPRLSAASLTRTPLLQTKAGTVERERGRAWMAKRERVAQHYSYRCAKCGAVWVSSRDHIDHIVELADGGTNNDDNLQPLCDVPCHKAKTTAQAKGRVQGS